MTKKIKKRKIKSKKIKKLKKIKRKKLTPKKKGPQKNKKSVLEINIKKPLSWPKARREALLPLMKF